MQNKFDTRMKMEKERKIKLYQVKKCYKSITDRNLICFVISQAHTVSDLITAPALITPPP